MGTLEFSELFNKRVGMELLGGVVAIPKQRAGRRPEKSE